MYKPNLFLCCCFLLFTSSVYSVCNFSTIKGDTDKNGVVDVSDLSPILRLYGIISSSLNYDCEVDADESGRIDVGDLSPILLNYGKIFRTTQAIESCPTDGSCIKLVDITIPKGTTEVEVPISFSQITDGVGAALVEIYYDSSKMTTVNAYPKEGELGSGGKSIKFNNIPAIAPSTQSTARIAFIDDISQNGTSGSGTLLSVKFTVNQNIIQSANITITLELNIKSLGDANSKQISLNKVANGLMTLQ